MSPPKGPRAAPVRRSPWIASRMIEWREREMRPLQRSRRGSASACRRWIGAAAAAITLLLAVTPQIARAANPSGPALQVAQLGTVPQPANDPFYDVPADIGHLPNGAIRQAARCRRSPWRCRSQRRPGRSSTRPSTNTRTRVRTSQRSWFPTLHGWAPGRGPCCPTRQQSMHSHQMRALLRPQVRGRGGSDRKSDRPGE